MRTIKSFMKDCRSREMNIMKEEGFTADPPEDSEAHFCGAVLQISAVVFSAAIAAASRISSAADYNNKENVN